MKQFAAKHQYRFYRSQAACSYKSCIQAIFNTSYLLTARLCANKRFPTTGNFGHRATLILGDPDLHEFHRGSQRSSALLVLYISRFSTSSPCFIFFQLYFPFSTNVSHCPRPYFFLLAPPSNSLCISERSLNEVTRLLARRGVVYL